MTATPRRVSATLKEILIALIGGTVIFLLVGAYTKLDTLLHRARWYPSLIVGLVAPANLTHYLTKSTKTLLIATSSSCQYSRSNEAFHKKLIATAIATGITPIVLVPDEASAKMATNDFPPPTKVIIVNHLSEIGVSGTPLIALIDPQRYVRNLWTGSLPGRYQSIVSSQVAKSGHILSDIDLSDVHVVSDKVTPTVTSEALSATDVSKAPSSPPLLETIPDAQLNKRLATYKVIDVGARVQNLHANALDLINIPVDELSVRSRYEMATTSTWVVDCSRVSAAECDLADYDLVENGFRSIYNLDRGAEGAFCQTTPTR